MASLIHSRARRIIELDRYPFHMPGHKGGLRADFGEADITELPGMDNFHNPRGTIALAQARVAAIYQVPKTFFLVNGTSIGLMAALMTMVGPGDQVIIERNCHKAIISSLIHCGAMPVFVSQQFCPRLKVWLPPRPQAAERVMAAHQIKAAVFTNPGYLGLVPDIVGLVRICRARGVKVLADEAHGAHLFFGRHLGLPISAAKAGADLVVQSAHKTLPVFTQSAWLHLQERSIAEAVQQALNLFHTTSPSYPLLASLEKGAIFAGKQGRTTLSRLKLWLGLLEARCRKAGLGCWSFGGRDWTKLVIERRQGSEDMLRSRGFYHELTVGKHLLFYTTMVDGHNPSSLKALISLVPLLAQLPRVKDNPVPEPPPLEMALTPREAWQKDGRKLSLAQARGRICRQVLAPYPPGTLISLPGQMLNSDTINYLQMLYDKRVIPGWISVI